MMIDPKDDGLMDDQELDGMEDISTADMVAGWRQDVSLQDRKFMVHEAIQALPADQRRLIVLRFFEESTFEECAESMGIGADECRRLYRTACAELARLLK